MAFLGNCEFEFSASCCGWPDHAIAADCRIHLSTVYNQANNLLRYGSIKAPGLRKLERPRKLTAADEEAVLELLLAEGWRRQDEIVFGSGVSVVCSLTGPRSLGC